MLQCLFQTQAGVCLSLGSFAESLLSWSHRLAPELGTQGFPESDLAYLPHCFIPHPDAAHCREEIPGCSPHSLPSALRLLPPSAPARTLPAQGCLVPRWGREPLLPDPPSSLPLSSFSSVRREPLPSPGPWGSPPPPPHPQSHGGLSQGSLCPTWGACFWWTVNLLVRVTRQIWKLRNPCGRWRGDPVTRRIRWFLVLFFSSLFLIE